MLYTLTALSRSAHHSSHTLIPPSHRHHRRTLTLFCDSSLQVDFGKNLAREFRITIIKYLVATNQLFQGAKPVPFAFDGKANMYVPPLTVDEVFLLTI